MLVYLTVVVVCIVVSSYYSYVHGSETIKNKNIDVLFVMMYAAIAVALVCIIGFRSDNVGIDTQNYKEMFYRHETYNFDYILKMDWYEEPLFAFICISVFKLGLTWEFFIMLMAALFVVPVSILAYKKGQNYFWVMAFFVLGGSYLFAVSAIRQAAAIGITILAFLAEEKKCNVRCVLLLLLASLLHVSSLISLVYFIALKIKLNRKTIVFWLVAGVCVAVVLNSTLQNFMFDFLEEIDKGSYEQMETGGLFREFYYIATLFIAFFFTDIFDTEDQFDLRYFKALFIVASILPVIRTNPTFFRVYMYFSIYEILFIPQILSRLKMREIKPAATAGFMAMYGYFFYSNIESTKLMEYSTYLF